MKVEIVQSESINELDQFVNSVIQDRRIVDMKLTTTVLPESRILYTVLIMLGT